jgi:hypothetical protein
VVVVLFLMVAMVVVQTLPVFRSQTLLLRLNRSKNITMLVSLLFNIYFKKVNIKPRPIAGFFVYSHLGLVGLKETTTQIF